MKGARIYRKRLTGWIVLSLFTIHSSLLPALEVSHTAMDGSDSVPAEYFRKWYHRSDLIYYLEALNDHTIVETPATGQWWQPDRLNIAIAGLPCTMSSYTIDGLRVDKAHVLVSGALVADGDAALVDDINQNGYEKYLAAE